MQSKTLQMFFFVLILVITDAANENQNSVSQNIRIHDHPYSINCGYLLFFETTLGRVSQGVNWSWSQCIKSHHAQESSGKGLPSHFWNRNIVRNILPGLRRKITGLLLSGPKSSFQLKVHFAFHLEIRVPESGGRVERHRINVAWSPVLSFHSLWWFGLACHLLVLVHCVFWSPQSTHPSTRRF